MTTRRPPSATLRAWAGPVLLGALALITLAACATNPAASGGSPTATPTPTSPL